MPRDDEAYRGYLIRRTITGEIFIEKEGMLIGWVQSIEDAKQKIDELHELHPAKNPMTLPEARRIFGELMKKAREGSLTVTDKALLSRARQTLRAERKGKLNIARRVQHPPCYYCGVRHAGTHAQHEALRRKRRFKGRRIHAERFPIREVLPNRKKSRYSHERLGSSKGLHHFRTVTVGGHRVIIGCPKAHLKGGRCPVATVATSILHPKANPKQRRQLIRMGKLVELRYHRDHGKSRGYYRHAFKTKPTLYYDRNRNQILAG
jgi:hypothetical protein